MKKILSVFTGSIISIVHFLAIIFVVIAPFSNLPGVLTINITYTMSLLTHWYFNNDICCLTLLESYIRGVKTDKTFMYSLVSPIYSGISEPFLSKLSWGITVISLGVSFYKLFFVKAPKTFNQFFCLKNC